MAKKKGNKLPKGARQNKREKMLARKHSAAQTPVTEAIEEPVKAAESAVTGAPVAASNEEKAVAATAETAKKPTATKKAAAKKPAVKKAPTENEAKDAAAPAEKKKPGPKTGEQKAEARKERKEPKAAAANVKTTVYIQFKGMEDGVEDLVAAARADYKAAHKRTQINSIKLYVKPEEYTAYYVVNDSYFGKVKM